MHEEHIKWYSHSLATDIDILIFGTKGLPVILFPTSMGRYFENKDFKLIDSVSWFVEQGFIKIICPDGIDKLSWYNKNIHPSQKVKNHILYDIFLKSELIPAIQKDSGFSRIATAGCSFGAYHATNFGFKHPDVVKYVINMSGAYDIKSRVKGYYDENVYFNNPLDFIPNNWSEFYRDFYVFLGVGEYDVCLEPNLVMDQLLNQKQIKHWLDIRKGAQHDWPIWREMFPHYISMIVNNQL